VTPARVELFLQGRVAMVKDFGTEAAKLGHTAAPQATLSN